jgi:hypothetical protein
VALLVVVVVAVLAGASWLVSSKKMASPERAVMSPAPPPGAPAEVAGEGEMVDRSGDASAGSAGGGRAPGASLATAEAAMPRQEIIYTGDMRVEVDDVAAAASQVEKTVSEAGGRASDRQMNTDAEGHRTATIAARFPAAKFTAVHDALLKLGDVISDRVQSQDVGKQFVDLEARLKNLVREETVVAGLFSREGKIGDVLQVERELARVRGEIEQIQGELRYLKDQVAYSTLTVTLAPKRPAIERKMESWNLGYHVLRAWRALVAVARALTYFVIYTVIVVGPFVLLAWIVGRIVRAARRRRAAKAGLPPAPEP